MRPVLGRGQGAVQEKGRDAVFPELVHLVLHQGDERRDHDRQPGDRYGRDLVAEGLAPARRHDDQGVLFPQDMGDDLLLEGPEGVKAEDVLEERLRLDKLIAPGFLPVSADRCLWIRIDGDCSRMLLANTDSRAMTEHLSR